MREKEVKIPLEASVPDGAVNEQPTIGEYNPQALVDPRDSPRNLQRQVILIESERVESIRVTIRPDGVVDVIKIVRRLVA
jgi:hypothetical protein